MKNSFPRLVLVLALLIAPLLLSACETTDENDNGDASNNVPVISETPPPSAPLVHEDIPMIPDPQNEIWRTGYWVLSGGTFDWVPGKVIPRPSPTAVWIGAHWEKHTFGWSFQQGHWQ